MEIFYFYCPLFCNRQRKKGSSLTEGFSKKEGTPVEDFEIVDLYWARSQDAIARTAEKYGGYCLAIARGFCPAGKTPRRA